MNVGEKYMNKFRDAIKEIESYIEITREVKAELEAKGKDTSYLDGRIRGLELARKIIMNKFYYVV